MRYKTVVIGASAGGMEALGSILKNLSEDFCAPIIIVQHLSPHSDGFMYKYLDSICSVKVKEAEEKEKIVGGVVYIAPPNYHLLIESDKTLSLTVESKVNYARPSIDVLFESAADAFRDEVIGIILTGANRDGSMGLRKIKDLGGVTIVQDPSTAESEAMPRTAINTVKVDYILKLEEIAMKLSELVGGCNESER